MQWINHLGLGKHLSLVQLRIPHLNTSNARGFSLIEFLIALALSTLFALVMVKLLNNTTHQANTIKDVTTIAKTSRTGLFIMSRDIANAGYLLNCVGRDCASMLITPSPMPTTGIAPTGCAFSGISNIPCQAITYTTAPTTLTLNYAALNDSDPIQVKYSVDSSSGTSALRREETHAKTATFPKTDSYIANNVVQMAINFGLDTTNSGSVTSYSTTMTNISQLRSIKLALLTRSELPDKKYNSPSSINWLGGTYVVPTDQTHYRFKTIQQEVFLINATIVNP